MRNNYDFSVCDDNDSSLSFLIAKSISLLFAIALRVRKSDNNCRHNCYKSDNMGSNAENKPKINVQN